MRVDSRDLRGRVGAYAERPPRQLVDQFERLEIERLAGAGQQRFEVLKQRWNDQLVAVSAGHVQHLAAQFLDAARLRRQEVGDVLGQQPSR